MRIWIFIFGGNMGNIVLLDDLTINQIAAGEVIERPSSVVKEMVENSIDAGAKNITVEIKDGGISLIRVTDDGKGIATDDMEIAFERHSTSKIRSSKDLEKVKTMGFRGEALASIAAIAKVEMISKRMFDDNGNRIVIKGGEVEKLEECGCPNGTKITVEDLFYNTPVRYKFLKKDYTEAGYVEDVVTHAALSHKDISFTLINNGKTVLHTSGNDDYEALVYSIYGKDVADNIILIDYDFENIHITGFIGNSKVAKSSKSDQIFFINKRFVKDKTLISAVDKAYKNKLPNGKFALTVLNLEMDLDLVDVNVHPAKLEVRFKDEGTVFKAVYHAIENALQGQEEMFIDDEEKQISIDKRIAEYKDRQAENKKSMLEKFKSNRTIIDEEIKTPKPKLSNTASSERINELIENAKRNIQNLGKTLEEKDVDSDMAKYINEEKEEPISEEKPSELKMPDFKDDTIFQEDTIVDDAENLDARIILKSEELSSDEIEELKNEEKIDKEEVLDEEYSTKPLEPIKKEVVPDTQTIEPKDLSNNKETVILDSVKLESSKETQIIDAVKKEVSQETQVLDSVKSGKESLNIDDEEDDDISNTQLVDTTVKTSDNSSADEQEEKELDNAQEEKIIDNSGSIAEKLISQKLQSDMYDTQFVNTKAVREALNNNEPLPKEFEEMYKKTFGVDVVDARQEQEKEEKEKSVAEEFSAANIENISLLKSDEEEIPDYRYVGSLFDDYIIIEMKSEMYIVDSLKANEKIIYYNLRDNYYNEEEKDSQQLLLPDVITLNTKQMFSCRESTLLFEKAGFKYDEFGENTIRLTNVPGICEKLNTKQLFIEMIDSIEKIAVTDTLEKEDKFIQTIALGLANEDKFELTEDKAKELINGILQLENPFDLNGTPIAIKMTRYDLEKKFSRR
jgi:DNA mismatch repair protein MutL